MFAVICTLIMPRQDSTETAAIDPTSAEMDREAKLGIVQRRKRRPALVLPGGTKRGRALNVLP